MRFFEKIRRRSTFAIRKINGSTDSQLSNLSNSSVTTQNASPSSLVIIPGSSHPSTDTSPPSSVGTSPSPSEFALANSNNTAASKNVSQPESDSIASSKNPIIPHIDNYTSGKPSIHQVVLIEGHIPLPKISGTLTVRPSRNSTPTTSWPVLESKFKALVYLHSGRNIFTMDLAPHGSKSRYSSTWTMDHHPMTSCPVVKLVIIHAKDSIYAQESAQLTLAMAKYRLAAYLWQSFIAEQMGSNESCSRTFQMENEWRESLLFSQDMHTHEMRNETPVHVVSIDKTLDEINRLSKEEFVSCVEHALVGRFNMSSRQKSYFSCLFMDSTPDRGHVYGGPGFVKGENLQLAIYGDQLLSLYPSSIDRVASAFSDETPMEGLPVRWKCAASGIGGHLQQFLYMLGLKDQAYGIMSDDYNHFAAMFSLYAAQQSPSPRLHPLDILRLRYHETMRSPFGPIERIRPNTGPTFFGVNESSVKMSSGAGLLAIEIYTPGDTRCKYWIDLLDSRRIVQYSYIVTLNDVCKAVISRRSSRLSLKLGPFDLRVLTADGLSTSIQDFEYFARGLVVDKSKKKLFRSSMIGAPVNNNFQSAQFPKNLRMLSLTVYHNPGVCITGIEFVFETSIKVLFGSRKADASKLWPLKAIDGESLMGVELCVQEMLMGLRFFTSISRLSPWFGCAGCGTEYKLMPPETFRIAGVEGDVGESVTSLQFITTR